MTTQVPEIATLCIHAGRRPQAGDSAVVAPIYQTATFVPSPEDYALVEAGKAPESRFYTRYGNPTVAAVERRIASLEGAQEALLFASGNAATHATIMALALPGGHVLAADKLYGGTRGVLNMCLKQAGGNVTHVDFDDPEAMARALTPRTRLLVCESIANPTLEVAELPRLAEFAHEHGALLVVDATYATPIHQRPLELGADISLHSATKYHGGHSDLIAGVVSGSHELIGELTPWRMIAGACLDPHAAFLLDRGIKTLAVRMRAHCEGARALAEFLEGHRRVERVIYPGLASCAHHGRATELLTGMGGMVFFTLEGDDALAARVLSRLRLALVAPSLGGVETLVSQPALVSHAAMTEEERCAVGIFPGSVRVSVGIEDPADLIADFAQALA